MNIVISPHLDDAVLGLGQYLAAEPAQVITVFAGLPPQGTITDYDRSCGFASSVAAMRERRGEDFTALVRLGCVRRWLPFLDRQYREGPPPLDAITDQLASLHDPEAHMFAPLGIGHPDHRAVAECARAAVARHAGGDLPVELLVYHDLPARVLWPEQVVAVRAEIVALGWTIDPLPWPLEQGDRADKVAALRCYRSQIGDREMDPSFLVPETVWRLTK